MCKERAFIPGDDVKVFELEQERGWGAGLTSALFDSDTSTSCRGSPRPPARGVEVGVKTEGRQEGEEERVFVTALGW